VLTHVCTCVCMRILLYMCVLVVYTHVCECCVNSCSTKHTRVVRVVVIQVRSAYSIVY